MIHIGDNDLVSRAERLSKRDAYQADKGSRIHTKSDFARVSSVQKVGNTLAGSSDRSVHFLAFRIAAASLNVALEEVLVDRVKRELRNLSSSRVVEKYERWGPVQRRKRRTNGVDRKTPCCAGTLMVLWQSVSYAMQRASDGVRSQKHLYRHFKPSIW
jgi:hypothetical protein